MGGRHGVVPACRVEGGGRRPVAWRELRGRGVEVDAAGRGEDMPAAGFGGGIGEVDGGGLVDHFCDHGYTGEETEGFVLQEMGL